jgi:hypothetical protein
MVEDYEMTLSIKLNLYLIIFSFLFVNCTRRTSIRGTEDAAGSSCVLPVGSVLPVTSFGVVGDGLADDTNGLRSAFTTIGTQGGILRFEANKTYKISGTLLITGSTGFVIDGNGATIIMAPGVSTVDNRLVAIDKSNNFSIINLIIDGNRNQRTPAESWGGHNVHINGGHDWTLCNVITKNACTDGFYITAATATEISTYPHKAVIKDCTSDNNFRQGLSLINGYDIRVIGGLFTNTNGTAPEAGIDLEPNSSSANPGIWDILIHGVRFENNQGSGLTAGGPIIIDQVTVEDSIFINNGRNEAGGSTDLAGIHIGFSHSLIQRNILQNHTSTVFRSVVDFPYGTSVTGNILIGNTFQDNTAIDYMIYVHSGSGEVNYILNNLFINNVGQPLNNNNEKSFSNPNGTCAAGNLNNGIAFGLPENACGVLPTAGYSP